MSIRLHLLTVAVATLAASVLGAACSSGDALEQASEAQSGTTFSACRIVSVKDGHVMTADELAKLGDPVANLILKGRDCPQTLTQIQAKLAKNDPCAVSDGGTDKRNGGNGKEDEGVTSRFVTDRSQLLERPDTYRAVITRACQQRSDNELLLSVFGISTQTNASGIVSSVDVPDDSVELIGERKTAPDESGISSGVFNFYAREDNQWKYFGSSTELLSQGYDCNADGACVPKAASTQRCAACHVGGGLNMKELESPWTSWEGGQNTFGKHALDATGASFGTPGVPEIVAKRPDLFGTQSDGIAQEATVSSGNGEWIRSRIAFLKTQGLKEVLRPLFCTTDMNLQSTGLTSLPDQDGKAPRDVANFLANDLFVDRIWRAGLDAGAQITFGEYMDAIAANGQHIEDGRTHQGMVGADGKPILDTVQGLTIPVRSGQDTDYITALQGARVVDIDLVKDVLNIDFTRPIYSGTRCQLLDKLDFRPELPPDQMTFHAVKAKVADAVGRVTNPSREMTKLLANLQDPTDAGKHDFEAIAFLKACDERSKTDRAAYIKDYLAYASHLRRAVKRVRNPVNGGIIEFAETLPVDNIPETRAAFDAKTCKLQ